MGDFSKAFTLGVLFLIVLQINETFAAAETSCPYLVQHNTSFHPACDNDDLMIKWPNYENPKVYYACLGVNRAVLVPCPPEQYFIFVLQTCGPCDQYISPVTCFKLPTENPPVCTDSNGTNNPSQPNASLPTPRYPTPSTTLKPTTPKTTSTPKPKPTRPPNSTSPVTDSTVKPSKRPPTPPGTGNKPTTPSTLIPPPPSPPATNTNVPLPPTPPPTPPMVNVEPPYQTGIPMSKSN